MALAAPLPQARRRGCPTRATLSLDPSPSGWLSAESPPPDHSLTRPHANGRELRWASCWASWQTPHRASAALDTGSGQAPPVRQSGGARLPGAGYRSPRSIMRYQWSAGFFEWAAVCWRSTSFRCSFKRHRSIADRTSTLNHMDGGGLDQNRADGRRGLLRLSFQTGTPMHPYPPGGLRISHGTSGG